jgi:hypothetical protein
MTEPITSKPFSLTPEETFKVIWAALVTRRHRLLLFYPFIGLLLIAFGSRGAGFPVIIVGAFCLAIVPFMALAFRLKCKQAARLLQAESTAVLTETHYEQHDSLGNHSSLPWESFKKAMDWPGYVLLYTAKSSFVILPKRALSSNQSVKVTKLLKEKGLLK